VRLANERGWLFERHPEENYPLLERLRGTQVVSVSSSASERLCRNPRVGSFRV
jgi:hypothetical protein